MVEVSVKAIQEIIDFLEARAPEGTEKRWWCSYGEPDHPLLESRDTVWCNNFQIEVGRNGCKGCAIGIVRRLRDGYA